MDRTYAILNHAGFVTNVIVAPPSFATQYYPGSIEIDSLSPRPGIGWAYAMGSFVPPAS